MNHLAPRTATIASIVAVALFGCSRSTADQVPETPVQDPMKPVHKEMIEPFTGMDLSMTPPGTAAEYPALRIETVTEGSGGELHYGMIGRFHYVGSLADGKVFKSTYDGENPEPATLRVLDGVMPKGLAIALEGCKVGERRFVTIPADLAFGNTPNYSQGALIPARATLTYDIELVSIVDGLKMKVLREGAGDALEFGQRAKFHYTGVLAENGKQFDSTGLGEPFETALRQGSIIDGWSFGLPGMRTGEKRRLWIPSDLAYGKRGNNGIPADADLVFDVELVEIMK